MLVSCRAFGFVGAAFLKIAQYLLQGADLFIKYLLVVGVCLRVIGGKNKSFACGKCLTTDFHRLNFHTCPNDTVMRGLTQIEPFNTGRML
jgi:hypothetical protein